MTILITLVLSYSNSTANVIAAGGNGLFPGQNGGGGEKSNCQKQLVRTYKPQNCTNAKIVDYSITHNNKSGISFDLTKMQQIYQTSDIEYNFTDEGETYIMDIGVVDYDNPQTWIMPNINFVNTEIGENAVLEESEYYEFFEEATHLKFYNYPEDLETFSEFYKFSEEKIEIIGGVLETNIYKGIFIDTLSYLMTTLPLDLNTDFTMKDTLNFNDTTYAIESNIWVEGYGTLQTPDGTFDALKIANEYFEDIYVDDELIEEYSEALAEATMELLMPIKKYYIQ